VNNMSVFESFDAAVAQRYVETTAHEQSSEIIQRKILEIQSQIIDIQHQILFHPAPHSRDPAPILEILQNLKRQKLDLENQVATSQDKFQVADRQSADRIKQLKNEIVNQANSVAQKGQCANQVKQEVSAASGSADHRGSTGAMTGQKRAMEVMNAAQKATTYTCPRCGLWSRRKPPSLCSREECHPQSLRGHNAADLAEGRLLGSQVAERKRWAKESQIVDEKTEIPEEELYNKESITLPIDKAGHCKVTGQICENV